MLMRIAGKRRVCVAAIRCYKELTESVTYLSWLSEEDRARSLVRPGEVEGIIHGLYCFESGFPMTEIHRHRSRGSSPQIVLDLGGIGENLIGQLPRVTQIELVPFQLGAF